MVLAESSASVILGSFAAFFAAIGSSTLALFFSVLALAAAGFAVHRVDELGKFVEGRADRLSNEIDRVAERSGGDEDDGGSG